MRFNISLPALMFATILSTASSALPILQNGLSLAASTLGIKTPRSACADPSLTQTLFQAFDASTTVHVFNHHWAFVNANTATSSNLWTDQHAAFRAWTSQQPFTVPLFQLANADRTEYIYLLNPAAQVPPTISGFTTDVGVVAWVYDSPVCGSVPLLGAAYASGTDHHYTTDANEHAGILTVPGWADSGVVAYVLPFSTS